MKKVVGVVSLITTLLMMPAAVFAQASQEDLRSAIQVSVLSDPRVANIPPGQLTELIDALVAQALAQHMTPADILWQPQNAAAASAVPDTQTVCEAGWKGYLCQLDHIFGFSGSSYELPLIIIVTSGILLAVIWEIIHHHHKKLEEKGLSSPALNNVVQK